MLLFVGCCAGFLITKSALLAGRRETLPEEGFRDVLPEEELVHRTGSGTIATPAGSGHLRKRIVPHRTTTVAVTAYSSDGCMKMFDKGWRVWVPLRERDTYRATTVHVPFSLPMQPYISMGATGIPVLNGTRPAPIFYLNTPDLYKANRDACLTPANLETLQASTQPELWKATALQYNPSADKKNEFGKYDCSLKLDPHPLEDAAKCDLDDKSTVFVTMHESEAILGIFHTLLNKHQMFSLLLEILADEAMTAALMNTRAANETTPSCRVTKPKRVFLMGGQWQKGNEPNLTNRVKVAMEQVLAEEHGIELGWSRPWHGYETPVAGTIWTVRQEEMACNEGPCYLMAQPNHAELLRNKMLAPVPPAAAVASPNHAEILLVNRYEKFRRHIYHADDVLTQLKTTLQSHGYTTGSKHVLDFGVYDDKQADLAFNHSVFIAAHGQASANFVYSPECAVQLELFPNGGYNHMYGVHSVSTGHIYGIYYVQLETPHCHHPKPPSESVAGSDYRYRECARQQNFDLNMTLLEPYLLRLLDVRKHCLKHGIGAIPIPNLTDFQIRWSRGDTTATPDMYPGLKLDV